MLPLERHVIECRNVDTGKRVDVFLAETFEDISRSAISSMIEKGLVTADGRVVKKSEKVKDGMILTVLMPPMQPCDALPEDIPLDIVFEDSSLLVVNKPKGMVAHPAPGNYSGTLANALLFHCGDSLSGINGVARPGIVHRIDKDTSGLLIVAKTDAAHKSLSKQISEHSFVRRYEAVIFGKMKEPEGVINLPIGRHPRDRVKMAVVNGGRNAITEYRTLGTYVKPGGPSYSHMQIELKTGRTHQIRVHFSYYGHAIAGDPTYGNPARDSKFFPFLNGQCLHARYIEFTHPVTGERLAFNAKRPEEFEKVLTILQSWNMISK